MAHFGCPYCKSEMIDAECEVYAFMAVTDWTEHGEPEIPYDVIEVGDILEIDDRPGRYRCRTCWKSFTEPLALAAPTDSISGRAPKHEDVEEDW